MTARPVPESLETGRAPQGRALAFSALLVFWISALPATPVRAWTDPGEGRPSGAPMASSEVSAGPAGETAPDARIGSAEDSPGRRLLNDLAGVYLAMETLRIDFLQTQDWVGMEETPPWKGSILLMRPDKFRIEYEEPEGHLQVGDGERVWTYVPENEEVLVTRLSDPEGPGGDLLRWILETGSPEPEVVRHSVNGKPARLLTLHPPEGLGIDCVRIWVEPEGTGILQYELVDGSGNRNTYRVRSLKPNVDLSPSLFRFEPPEGVPVVELGSP